MDKKEGKDIIVIVDDSIIDLMVVEAAIEDHYKTYTVTSVHVLFPILERLIPDLILMDINMPDINGFDAIIMLQNDPKYCNIPVIFVTGDTDIETKIRAINAGVIDVITKPIDIDIILSCIEKSISSSKDNKKLL